MARYAMQWFVYEGGWHLCHLCHLCRPCHHDMEGGGGGGHRKVCRGTCRDMGKLQRNMCRGTARPKPSPPPPPPLRGWVSSFSSRVRGVHRYPRQRKWGNMVRCITLGTLAPGIIVDTGEHVYQILYPVTKNVPMCVERSRRLEHFAHNVV